MDQPKPEPTNKEPKQGLKPDQQLQNNESNREENFKPEPERQEKEKDHKWYEQIFGHHHGSHYDGHTDVYVTPNTQGYGSPAYGPGYGPPPYPPGYGPPRSTGPGYGAPGYGAPPYYGQPYNGYYYP